MSTDDETREIPGATDDECPSCGSGSRSGAYYVPGRTGMPVTCTSDWHDEDAQGPGAPGTAVLDETRAGTSVFGPAEDHEPTLVSLPAYRAQDPAPARAPAIHCPGCGETFADAGFGGKALFLSETLHAAALAAGWSEDDGRWKCSVCLAGITGPLYGPEREPAPSLPAPDSDPLDQSLAVLAEADARKPGFWAEVNRSNNATADKNRLRFRDGFQGFEALFDRIPGLESDPEAAVALLNYEADLTERAAAMHRASMERLEELRSAPSALYLETEVAA